MKRLKDITDDMLGQCGGKGASLVKLIRSGLPVPDGYVLMPDDDVSEVRKILPELKGTYAVRSSALNEDGEEASFAGAYETITDVEVGDIEKAVLEVRKSAENARVKAYAAQRDAALLGIAVVIQSFVRPEFAGVVFTSDVITGSAAKMIGNYVKGEGELLVSGVSNAGEFSFNAMKYSYSGSDEFSRYAKKLFGYCVKIRNLWGCPMDIEWAVSEGKVYILQARPVTTITRGREDLYELNGTKAGEFLMTRTNVGEIFGIPLSPMTYSIQRRICETVAMPHFIDIICGQAYLNISVVTSTIVSFGFSEKSALRMIKDIVGRLPEGVTVPIYPVSSKAILRKLLLLLKPKKKAKGMGLAYTDTIGSKMDALKTPEEVRVFWDRELMPYIMSALADIFKGMNITGLFLVRNKVESVCGEELTGRLLTGCVGILDSMKPMLYLEDLMEGRISGQQYISECGHRHSNEMELMMPFPYEDPEFLEKRMEEHRNSGVNVHRMQEKTKQQFEEALAEFESRYPSRKKWLSKKLEKYAKANHDRESVRSKGVKIFCCLRKYLLKAGEILNIPDDGIFMLYIDEVMELLDGDRSMLDLVGARRERYDTYLKYPQFPNIILGRFEPEKWMADPNRRGDFYSAYSTPDPSEKTQQIKGFPGAYGEVTGKVRVIRDISEAEQLQQGEILVTCATNIGWTIYFPRALAIVTDIGAPLSHAAIVAREFSIPAVVGCGNATTELKTGDIVTVNGGAGTVSIKERTDL